MENPPPETPISGSVFTILHIPSRFKAFCLSIAKHIMTSQSKSPCWYWFIYACPCCYNVTLSTEKQRRHYENRDQQWPAQNNHMAGQRRGRWRALHIKMGRATSIASRDIYPFQDQIKTAFQTKVRRKYMHVQKCTIIVEIQYSSLFVS